MPPQSKGYFSSGFFWIILLVGVHHNDAKKNNTPSPNNGWGSKNASLRLILFFARKWFLLNGLGNFPPTTNQYKMLLKEEKEWKQIRKNLGWCETSVLRRTKLPTYKHYFMPLTGSHLPQAWYFPHPRTFLHTQTITISVWSELQSPFF